MTQALTYREQEKNGIFEAGFYLLGTSSSSTVPVPWSGSPFHEIQKIRAEEINVVPSVLHQAAARAFEKARSQILQRAEEWVSRLESVAALDESEMKLGVEREIVLRMPPYARRPIQVRAKYTGPAKPQVVYDPLPEDEERKQE